MKRLFSFIISLSLCFNVFAQAFNGEKITADVFIQDQTSEPIDVYLINIKGNTTSTADLNISDTTVTVSDATGAVIGEAINIKGESRLFQSIVTGITGLDKLAISVHGHRTQD